MSRMLCDVNHSININSMTKAVHIMVLEWELMFHTNHVFLMGALQSDTRNQSAVQQA